MRRGGAPGSALRSSGIAARRVRTNKRFCSPSDPAKHELGVGDHLSSRVRRWDKRLIWGKRPILDRRYRGMGLSNWLNNLIWNIKYTSSLKRSVDGLLGSFYFNYKMGTGEREQYDESRAASFREWIQIPALEGKSSFPEPFGRDGEPGRCRLRRHRRRRSAKREPDGRDPSKNFRPIYVASNN
jgi:hypothetical protein